MPAGRVTTIGVISDTHGLLRPEALLTLKGSEYIIHAGDIGEPAILGKLAEIAPVIAVRGNIDKGAWAKKIPTTNVLEVGGVSLYVLHDLAQLDLKPEAAGFAAVIYGHSHIPRQEMKNGVLYFNPGSAGPRRFKLPVSVGRLLITNHSIRAEVSILNAWARMLPSGRISGSIQSLAMPIEFQVEATSGSARSGRLLTPHGEVETPVFMPVGTLASVKGVSQDILEELGVQILLGNTYHLYLRPGVEQIRKLGGLHRFMAWPRAILTDSGGFQVFSLNDLRKVSEQGVTFRSHLDGSSHFLSPESATEAQIGLGADIIMAFDECTEYPADGERMRASMELTLRWAGRSKKYFDEHKHEVPWAMNRVGADALVRPGERRLAGSAALQSARQVRAPASTQTQALFGIVQGGMDFQLRKESALRTIELGFRGYAIGGLSVGEPRILTREVVEATLEHLPADRPRYLMGVGTPEEIVKYANLGIDMMDCVLPTRAARHGLLFTSQGKISIKQVRYAGDDNPLDPACRCRVCARYSRAYLRHLYASNEVLAQVLNTVHNLSFYLDTMRSVRHSIGLGSRACFLSGEQSD